jgi:hypothetical protein
MAETTSTLHLLATSQTSFDVVSNGIFDSSNLYGINGDENERVLIPIEELLRYITDGNQIHIASGVDAFPTNTNGLLLVTDGYIRSSLPNLAPARIVTALLLPNTKILWRSFQNTFKQNPHQFITDFYASSSADPLKSVGHLFHEDNSEMFMKHAELVFATVFRGQVQLASRVVGVNSKGNSLVGIRGANQEDAVLSNSLLMPVRGLLPDVRIPYNLTEPNSILLKTLTILKQIDDSYPES